MELVEDVRIEGLRKSFGDLDVLRGVTFTLSAGGVTMELSSTEPGLQVYAAGHLSPGAIGIGGKPYDRHAGIALESQVWPDAPNHPGFPSAELEPGQIYRQVTAMRFQTKEA